MAGRRGRGLLEADVKRITDAYVTGEYEVPEGKPLTAYRIAQAMKELDSLEELPSVGAVSYVLDRWNEIGFAKMARGPYAFEDYTEAGRTEGLTALHAKAREERKLARRAAKEAEKAADEKVAELVGGVVTPEGIVPAEAEGTTPVERALDQDAPEAPQEADDDDEGIAPPIVHPLPQEAPEGPAEGDDDGTFVVDPEDAGDDTPEAPRKWADQVLSDAYSEA